MDQGASEKSQSRAFGLLAVLALLLGLSLSLLGPPTASAQLPAVCEQYPDLPGCVDPDDDGDANDENDEDAGPAAGAGGPSGGDGDGSLPFTGYPLTSLILLLLALLAIGLAIRLSLAIRGRLATRH